MKCPKVKYRCSNPATSPAPPSLLPAFGKDCPVPGAAAPHPAAASSRILRGRSWGRTLKDHHLHLSSAPESPKASPLTSGLVSPYFHTTAVTVGAQMSKGPSVFLRFLFYWHQWSLHHCELCAQVQLVTAGTGVEAIPSLAFPGHTQAQKADIQPRVRVESSQNFPCFTGEEEVVSPQGTRCTLRQVTGVTHRKQIHTCAFVEAGSHCQMFTS